MKGISRRGAGTSVHHNNLWVCISVGLLLSWPAVSLGAVLYGAGSTGSGWDRLVRIDPETAMGTQVGLFGPGCNIYALSSSDMFGYLYGAGNGPSGLGLFKIRMDTGAATWIGQSGGYVYDSLAYDKYTDTLYASTPAGYLYKVNQETGAMLQMWTISGPYVQSITWSEHGLIGESYGTFYRIETPTGPYASMIPMFNSGSSGWGLACDPDLNDGAFNYANANINNLYRVRGMDGATINVGPFRFTGTGQSFMVYDLAYAPEPSTLVLLTGLGALLLRRRTRR